jgi:hypothetical protein
LQVETSPLCNCTQIIRKLTCAQCFTSFSNLLPFCDKLLQKTEHCLISYFSPCLPLEYVLLTQTVLTSS